MSPLLTREEAAELLAVPPKTLACWASKGEGPPYFRVGRFARYRPEEVEAWLASQRGGRQADWFRR